jgi:hypothetical protein
VLHRLVHGYRAALALVVSMNQAPGYQQARAEKFCRVRFDEAGALFVKFGASGPRPKRSRK